jgi:hypothetical protein
MTIESGHPATNRSTTSTDGYITPGSRAFNRATSDFARSSRVVEESPEKPQLSDIPSSIELPPPPITPVPNIPIAQRQSKTGNFLRKVNPFAPKKHFFITLLVIGCVWAGFSFFDDIAGFDHHIIYEWGLSRNAVIERLNYENISHSIKDNTGSEVSAEISNSTINFPFNKELLKNKKIAVSYFFNADEKLRSISIAIPQIKRVEIFAISKMIGEKYRFDPTNSNPEEFAYITDDTKIWFVVRNESGDNVAALITLTARKLR